MALTYQAAVEQTITAGEQIHQIVNGTATTEVTVEDGSKVPSIRKALLDNFYFKDPIAWQQGQTENVFNQLRQFTDGSWWYAPSATASNPISMGSTPVGDVLWKIYDFDAIGKLEPRIDEALRRSYAEEGYNVVGTFRAGFTIVNANDIGIDEATGKGFTGPSGSVAAGTNPVIGGFVDVSTKMNFVIAKGSMGSALFQQLADSATSQSKQLLALCYVDAVSSINITCKLHPASKCLITPRLVAPALLWPDGEFVVKNSYQGEQTGLEVNNTNLVNGVSGTSLIGYLADSPEATHKRIVAKRFPVNIQCRNYSNRFVDCTGRVGGTGISAVGVSSSKEINALVIDGGDYTDNSEHNMFIGDTRFATAIPDTDYMGLGISIVNMPRVDQGGIKIDRVNSVKLNAYFEKVGTRYPIAIEIGGNKPSTRLKDYQIGGCVVRNYNYFVKANQRVDSLVIKPNDLYSVDYSGCYLTEMGTGFVYEEQTKTGVASMTRGQEVHTGLPSGLGGFDPFRNSTIIPHGLVGGVQNHVRDPNNLERPDFVTGSQLIVGTTDRLLRHYRNNKRCKIAQGAVISCSASGKTVTVALADVIKFNGGDLVTVDAVNTYVTSVNYETGVVTTDAVVSGATITHTVVLPTITGTLFAKPTEQAAEGSFVFNSLAASPLGWKYISGVWSASDGFSDKSNALNLGGVPFNSAIPKSSFLFGGGGVTILGDSISHGAFSRNIFRNNWTSILKRAWNADNNSENYGFVSLYGPLGTGGLLSKDIVEVSRSGFSSIEGASAAESPSGHLLQSQTTGAYIEVTLPSINGELRVCWLGGSGMGSFDVIRNGSLISTVDTSTVNGFATTQFNVSDNGRGKVVFRFESKSSATVVICGVMLSNQSSRNSVHNFSQSGRKLANASTAALTSAISGASTLIMALGHNDSFSSSDAAYMSTFNEKIDLIISLCKSNAIPVIVPDFCWRSPATDPVRVALKRLADETNGVYLPFPEWFKSDGSRFANTAQQVTTYKLFDDGSHPNIEGHKVIGAAICKALGLQHSCRDTLLRYHDWWLPVAIPVSSPLVNYSTDYDKILRAKRNGDLITLTGWLKNSAGGNVPVGEHLIADTASVSELGFTNTTELFLPALFTADSFVGHVRVKSAQFGISYKMTLGTFASVTLNNTLSVDFTY